MIAYLGNWRECPTAEQVAQYTHIVIAFAVSYTWNPSKNQCSQTCQIADPPICNNSPNPGLVQQWQAAGKKVILSFGGAGMGGSWASDNNDCWEYCYGREAQVTNRLVEIVKHCRDEEKDMDELTLMELLEPVRRVADVKAMAEYMGIDAKNESHLLWIAKMAVLDDLPDGWREEILPTGELTYVNNETNERTSEHPTEHFFRRLLMRERRKPRPRVSFVQEAFDWPPARYRDDVDPKGRTLRTKVIPASGSFLDFYDVYGRQFWYNVVTERVTLDLMEVKLEPAVIMVQRVFRAHKARARLWEVHGAAKKIGSAWRTFKFNRLTEEVSQRREKAVEIIQKFYRLKRLRLECSRELFKQVGLIGKPSFARYDKSVEGLMQSNYSFFVVRRHVVTLQRRWRQKMAERRGIKPPKKGKGGRPQRNKGGAHNLANRSAWED